MNKRVIVLLASGFPACLDAGSSLGRVNLRGDLQGPTDGPPIFLDPGLDRPLYNNFQSGSYP